MRILFTLALTLWATVDPSHVALASKISGIDIPRNRSTQTPSNNSVQMNGNLSCDSGRAAARLGLRCTLMIEDLKTGQIYGIENESADQSKLLDLYQAGHRNVAIVGSMLTPTLIRVSQAQSL